MPRYLPPASTLCLGVLLLGSSVQAQPAGVLSGTVTASTGAVLPDVTVEVRNLTTGLVLKTTTRSDGTYVVADIPVDGPYDVLASLSGFAPSVRSRIVLTGNQRPTVDFVLYAATAEALVVTARTQMLPTDRSTVQQTISEGLAHALPLIGRDFIALASLSAGFTGSPTAPSPQGQFYWTNNVLVDGASHFSKWRGAPRTFYSGYGLEAVREVQVLTSQFSAEYGEALASVTMAVTRSGTDALHGSALVFAQGGALNDIPAFTPTRPPFQSQRYGITAGGPLVADRAHFFTSYEGRRQRARGIVVSPVAPGARTRNDEDEHLFFAKADHKLSQGDRLTIRYNGQWFDWHNEPGGLSLPGTGVGYTNDVHTLLVSDSMLVNTRMLNQARFQFARYTDIRRDLNPSLYVVRAGYSVEGGALGPFGFGARPEDTWEGADVLSLRVGSHSLKVGGGVKYVADRNESLPYGRGAYYFAGDPLLFPRPFAFVQGLAPTDALAVANPRSLAVHAFAQDDWTVHPRLTVNAGLRYDVERISRVRHYTAPVDTNNVQPRVGFAWDAAPRRAVVRGGLGLYTQQQLLGYINRVQLEGADGTTMLTLTPASPLMPAYPVVLGSATIARTARDIVVLDPTFRNPYSMQATLGVEQSLYGMQVATDLIYLRGRDLMSIVDTNAPTSNVKPFVRTAAQADATRPVLPAPGGVRRVVALGNDGDSWYKAFQVKVDRPAGALQSMVSYTLAKADDRANYFLPEDSRNLGAEKGAADNDVRHNLSVGLTWQVPSAWRGWNDVFLSGLGIVRSGRPYTVTWGDDRNGTSQNDARPGGRNTARGGAFRTVDVALVKRFRRSTRTVDARVEAFNLLSTTNYDEYVGALNSPLFGQPVTAWPRRRIQLAAILRF